MTTLNISRIHLALLVALCTVGLGSGCKSNTFCEGGFVRADGGSAPTCEGLCKPSLCKNPNNVCVDNACAAPCTSHADCAVGQDCVPSTEDGTGKSLNVCRDNGKGKIGTPCPTGNECTNVMTCGDGSACSAGGSCAKGQCQALTCRSAGMDDASAYCTLNDCHSDSDCPGGYWCSTIRVPHQICGQPTPPPACGSTNDPCVDPSQNAANGTTFAPGNVCTQRNQCRVRGPCAPCSTDLDCSQLPGQRCVNGGCANDCASDADCQNGFQCTSGACVPRSGTCAEPTGKGQFCEPCRIDADCGAGLVCAAMVNGGLRACLLVSAPSCMTDADCPTAPSGLHAYCQMGTCAAVPLNQGLNLPACWCQNTGASCLTASDCCSMNCVGADPNSQTIGLCH